MPGTRNPARRTGDSLSVSWFPPHCTMTSTAQLVVTLLRTLCRGQATASTLFWNFTAATPPNTWWIGAVATIGMFTRWGAWGLRATGSARGPATTQLKRERRLPKSFVEAPRGPGTAMAIGPLPLKSMSYGTAKRWHRRGTAFWLQDLLSLRPLIEGAEKRSGSLPTDHLATGNASATRQHSSPPGVRTKRN